MYTETSSSSIHCTSSNSCQLLVHISEVGWKTRKYYKNIIIAFVLGCPINRLDIAIAYDLPELVGTYKRNLEEALNTANNPPKESTPSPKKTKKSAPGS